MGLIGLYLLRFIFFLAIGILVFAVTMNQLNNFMQAVIISLAVVVALFFGLPAIYRDR